MDNKKEPIQVWYFRNHKTFFADGGKMVSIPDGWVFCPSGDAALTRRIKATENWWMVVHEHKKRIESIGLCVPKTVLDNVKSQLEKERNDPHSSLSAAKRKREEKQAQYYGEFKTAVLNFLNFHERYAEIAEELAQAVTEHAIPVGSGTVARTKLIPIEQRAEAAVIAWMRHQTTKYDTMYIARKKGERRETRHNLAMESRGLLKEYRLGSHINLEKCPLAIALKRISTLKKRNEQNG